MRNAPAHPTDIRQKMAHGDEDDVVDIMNTSKTRKGDISDSFRGGKGESPMNSRDSKHSKKQKDNSFTGMPGSNPAYMPGS